MKKLKINHSKILLDANKQGNQYNLNQDLDMRDFISKLEEILESPQQFSLF